jgi:hypothetical protein
MVGGATVMACPEGGSTSPSVGLVEPVSQRSLLQGEFMKTKLWDSVPRWPSAFADIPVVARRAFGQQTTSFWDALHCIEDD